MSRSHQLDAQLTATIIARLYLQLLYIKNKQQVYPVSNSGAVYKSFIRDSLYGTYLSDS